MRPRYYARTHPIFSADLKQTAKDLKTWIRQAIFFLLDLRQAKKAQRDDSSMKEPLLCMGTQWSCEQSFEENASLVSSLETPYPLDFVSISR
jgi:hypothetical protein